MINISIRSATEMNSESIGTLLKQDNSIACHQFIIISRSRNSLFLQILLFISAKALNPFSRITIYTIFCVRVIPALDSCNPINRFYCIYKIGI